MTVTSVARTGFVTVPSRSTPHRGSILDAAIVHDGVPWDTEGLVESFNCIGVDVDPVDCAGFKGLTKRFDPPSYGDGALFVVQSGMTCKAPGFSKDDPAIRKAFEALEPEGVGIGLHDEILLNGTDITPAAGAVTPAQALGLLEGVGYSQYAGVPIIHGGPAVVSVWAGIQAVTPIGTRLETHLGTTVVVAGGNETKTNDKIDPEQWAFVTGQVVLWRSEAIHAAELDRSTNDQTVLYERLYMAAVDCLVAKVKVKVL